jgi:hypothetical protein
MRLSTRAVVATLLLIGTSLGTAQPGAPPAAAADFAWQWSLDVPQGEQVVQFTLSPAVYARLARRDLRDLVAFNGAGEILPMGLATQLWAPAVEATAVLAVSQPLPMFRIPVSPALAADGLQLHIERDANGRLRQLHADIADTASAGTASDWLLDLSALRSPVPGLSFILDQRAVGSLNARIEIAGSRDLDHWQPVAAPQTLLSLQQGEYQLQRLEARFAPIQWPYLRLRRIDREGSIDLASVSAELQPAHLAIDERLALEMAGSAAADLPGTFDYVLPGPYPIERIGVALADRNALATVIVESRASADQTWRTRASGTAFRLAGNGDGDDIGADAFELPVIRDRYWRLRSEPALARAPVLQAGYRGEAFVVLAQGAGPYRLAGGSAKAQRPDFPLPAVLARLQAQRGRDWQPVAITLGAGQSLSGPAALIAPDDPVPLRQWLLWGVLIGAAVLIAGLALRLLREPGRG